MAPSHYSNQRWNIVTITLRNKLHWNFTRNSYICFQDNTFQNFVGELASILSRSLSDGIFITDCTGSCHFDRLRCNQWRKFRKNDISLSVFSFQLLITNLLWFCYRKVWHINRQTDRDEICLKILCYFSSERFSIGYLKVRSDVITHTCPNSDGTVA